ncbi:unnamed protein product [Candidula unifasciata]|uniref:G-protein coupled receptors family 1 profile domain-containing protein n=1 Tax=Candidula unifasciata TaxID=100452 RepID=A0A8S3YP15_9EUPU|nr:unnamed protein product [Candidula unifasciata]
MNAFTFENVILADDGLLQLFSDNFTIYNNETLNGSVSVTSHPHQTDSMANFTGTAPTEDPPQGSSKMKVQGCTMNYVDFTRYPYPGDTTVAPVIWELALKCSFLSIISLLAIIGNILIIVIVIFSKKMRTTTNYYIINLAVSDLMIACLPTWIYLVKNITSGWVLGAFLCKFNVFVQVCAMCTMSFTMIAIAGDRFFAIVFPLKARVTQRKVKVVVAIIWTLGAAIAVPPTLYYKYNERKWANYLETFCTEQWPMRVKPDGKCDGGKTAEQYYWTPVLVALNWLPMLLMTIMYSVIIQRLQFGRLSHNGSLSMSAVQQRSTKRVVIMMFVLLVTFMVCTIPFQVSTIYQAYKDTRAMPPAWYEDVYFSAISLMYSHSAINPMVYGAMNQTFRNGFVHLVARFRGRKNSSRRSQCSTLETTIKPSISVVNKGGLDASQATSETDLIRCSSQISLTAVKDPHDKK